MCAGVCRSRDVSPYGSRQKPALNPLTQTQPNDKLRYSTICSLIKWHGREVICAYPLESELQKSFRA